MSSDLTALGDQPDVLRDVRMGRAGPLAIDNAVEVVGIPDIGRVHWLSGMVDGRTEPPRSKPSIDRHGAVRSTGICRSSEPGSVPCRGGWVVWPDEASGGGREMPFGWEDFPVESGLLRTVSG